MRKIIQITTSISNDNYSNVTALCDDGTVWKHIVHVDQSWFKLPDIPQDEGSWVDRTFDKLNKRKDS